MSDLDPDFDDTVVVNRVPPLPPSPAAPDDVDHSTIVVERPAPVSAPVTAPTVPASPDGPDDSTLVVVRPAPALPDGPDDSTLVVVRPTSALPDDRDDASTVVARPAPEPELLPDDGDDETIVVERPATGLGLEPNTPDDDTIVVARPAPAPVIEQVGHDESGQPHEVIVTDAPAPTPAHLAGPAEPDDTIVVARPTAAAEPEAASADVDDTLVVERRAQPTDTPDDATAVVEHRAPAAATRLRRRQSSTNRAQRTRIVLPDDQEPSPRAVLGAGVGAVSTYSARRIPPAPTGALALPDVEAASRRDAPGMPSVVRASRRASAVVAASALAASVVSLVGLVLIARVVF